jgi:uncharacterized protein (DUF305 family)
MIMWLCSGVLAVAEPQGKHHMTWKGDDQFAKQISMHHQMGVQMNEMCQQKATRDELKHFCKRMAEGQQRDLQKLKTIPGLKVSETVEEMHQQKQQGHAEHDRSKIKHGEADRMDADTAKMHKEGMSMHSKLESASAEKFQSMFLRNMAKHHERAIMMSEQCEANSKNDQLKQLCSEMKSSQEQEKTQLEGWLQQWYPGQANTRQDSQPHRH